GTGAASSSRDRSRRSSITRNTRIQLGWSPLAAIRVANRWLGIWPMPLLEVHDLAKHFQSHAGVIHAVNGVSFSLDAGRSLALVGESGSGKSTVARCVVRL